MYKEQIMEVVKAALEAVQPENFIPDSLTFDGEKLAAGDKTFVVSSYKHIYTVAVGKAAVRMTKAVDTTCGEIIDSGIALGKNPDTQTHLPDKYRVVYGSHPVPTEKSIKATQEVFDFLNKTTEDDLVIFLISGGGSALLTLPQESITLEDWQHFSSLMLACGADIKEFNILRKHLDRAKGGGLALRAAPAESIVIILSDVVNSPLDIIASGPTVPDRSTYQDAYAVLEKYALVDKVRTSIIDVINAGMAGTIPETLKADHPCCEKITTVLAADNCLAARAAAEKGTELGLNSLVVSTEITGEARAVGKELAAMFSEIDREEPFVPRPALLVFGGETTVTIKGKGLGGRNLENALAAVWSVAGLDDVAYVTLATDGEDGPTDAAGAIVTGTTLQEGMILGIKPDEYLENNDSYHYFEAVGGLIKTGPTGTNVNDLTLLFVFSQ